MKKLTFIYFLPLLEVFPLEPCFTIKISNFIQLELLMYYYCICIILNGHIQNHSLKKANYTFEENHVTPPLK